MNILRLIDLWPLSKVVAFHACQLACMHRDQSVGNHCVSVSSGLILPAHPQTLTSDYSFLTEHIKTLNVNMQHDEICFMLNVNKRQQSIKDNISIALFDYF